MTIARIGASAATRIHGLGRLRAPRPPFLGSEVDRAHQSSIPSPIATASEPVSRAVDLPPELDPGERVARRRPARRRAARARREPGELGTASGEQDRRRFERARRGTGRTGARRRARATSACSSVRMRPSRLDLLGMRVRSAPAVERELELDRLGLRRGEVEGAGDRDVERPSAPLEDAREVACGPSETAKIVRSWPTATATRASSACSLRRGRRERAQEGECLEVDAVELHACATAASTWRSTSSRWAKTSRSRTVGSVPVRGLRRAPRVEDRVADRDRQRLLRVEADRVLEELRGRRPWAPRERGRRFGCSRSRGARRASAACSGRRTS